MLEGNPPAAGHESPRLDNRLHQCLIDKSGNRYIQKFFGQYTAAYYTAVIDRAAPEAHVVAEMAAQHRQILEARIAKHWARARRALPEHIQAQHPIAMKMVDVLLDKTRDWPGTYEQPTLPPHRRALTVKPPCYTWLLFVVLVHPAGALAVSEETPNKAARPNVLFISVDDLNDWTGCLGGHPQTKTPNIDRLAASGALFTNAHCPAPACNPSRTAIMTGISPHKSGLYDNRQKMREVLPDAVLLPKYFADHGYWAAGSGKILHYFIDAQSWDEYFPPKETEDPFPRALYPKIVR